MDSKPLTIAATAIAFLALAIVWIAENGSPFRDQGLVVDDGD